MLNLIKSNALNQKNVGTTQFILLFYMFRHWRHFCNQNNECSSKLPKYWKPSPSGLL